MTTPTPRDRVDKGDVANLAQRGSTQSEPIAYEQSPFFHNTTKPWQSQSKSRTMVRFSSTLWPNFHLPREDRLTLIPSSLLYRIRDGHQVSDPQHGLDAAARSSVRLLREAGAVLAVHWRGGDLIHDCLPPPSRRLEATAPLFGHAREPPQAIITEMIMYTR